MFHLKVSIQQYGWGRFGLQSEVAQLALAAGSIDTVSNDMPYAELWMGTHSSGANYLTVNNVAITFKEFIDRNPDVLGKKVRATFSDKLPFLFKVLSVEKSLSIQAHPNKTHAEQLHKLHPDVYKDDNHKPEMAIALTDFECLCAFRPVSEVKHFLESLFRISFLTGKSENKGTLIPNLAAITELRDLLGADMIARASKLNDESFLCETFAQLMRQDRQVISKTVTNLSARLNICNGAGSESDQDLTRLICRLNKQFPGDVGCLAPYFLNYLRLRPGEAIFLKANLPHAYLHGDCIECMACSDNVVRAGLTPKPIDVPTLVAMLDYTPTPPRQVAFKPANMHLDGLNINLFDPPVPDFCVERIEIQPSSRQQVISLPPVDSGSILLVVEGFQFRCAVDGGPAKSVDGQLTDVTLQRGSILFVVADARLRFSDFESHYMLLFRASCRLP